MRQALFLREGARAIKIRERMRFGADYKRCVHTLIIFCCLPPSCGLAEK